MDTTELRRLLSEGTALPWRRSAAHNTIRLKSDTRAYAIVVCDRVREADHEAEANAALIAAAVNALPHLLAVVDAAAVLDHAQHPWAGGHGPNGPTIDAAWRDLRNALRALEAGR